MALVEEDEATSARTCITNSGILASPKSNNPSRPSKKVRLFGLGRSCFG